MQSTKNRKINVGKKKYKIPTDVYKYIEQLANVIQLHEIAMIGWIKNCYNGDDDTYKEEFYGYVMSLQGVEDVLSKMDEVDKQKKEMEKNQISDKKEKVKE